MLTIKDYIIKESNLQNVECDFDLLIDGKSTDKEFEKKVTTTVNELGKKIFKNVYDCELPDPKYDDETSKDHAEVSELYYSVTYESENGKVILHNETLNITFKTHMYSEVYAETYIEFDTNNKFKKGEIYLPGYTAKIDAKDMKNVLGDSTMLYPNIDKLVPLVIELFCDEPERWTEPDQDYVEWSDWKEYDD